MRKERAMRKRTSAALVATVAALTLQPGGQSANNLCCQWSKSPIFRYDHRSTCSGCRGNLVTEKKYLGEIAAESRPGRAATREGCNCEGTNNFTFQIATRTRVFGHNSTEGYYYETEWDPPDGQSATETGTKYSGDQCTPNGEFTPDGWFDHLL